MTQEEFTKVLKKGNNSYKIKGDKLVVTVLGDVFLNDLTSLPSGVEFRGGHHVHLDSLTSLPPGVVFNNRGDVYLESLTSIHPGVEFNNTGYVEKYMGFIKGNVYLKRLTSIPPGVKFKNGNGVYLNSLIGKGKWFEEWKGNIEGIDSKRLLNLMISKGLFER
jgi:hypothetical protein